jgi:hypothetical protein
LTRLHHLLVIIFFLAILSERIEAQGQRYNISLSGLYITSSKIYHSYDDVDPLKRDQFFTISDIFGIGLDFRREFNDLRLQLGIRIEYIETSEIIDYTVSPSTSVAVKDGFRAIPIEITGYFLLPIPLPKWKFTVGAGCGLYWGSRKYSFESLSPEPLERKIGGGIHVVSGIEFPINDFFALRTEVKFRDVQFWSSEKFKEKFITSRGQIIALNNKDINSKILIDGILISAGIVYNM